MAGSDIITIDNLHEKLPTWSPGQDSHLYAIVDMGSNGIRFSITSLAPPNARLLTPVFSTRAAISLFDALTPSSLGQVFPMETIAAVADTLSHFSRLATVHGVPQSQIMVLATEAMRRAANAGEILKAISEATNGLGVHILDPPVETLLGAVMGSRSGLVDVNEGGLFLDLGGGSVQMTWVDTSKAGYEIEAALAGQSLPYGAAKLSRILDEQPQEVKATEINSLRDGIKDVFMKLCSKFPRLQAKCTAYEEGDIDTGALNVYMCGGGFRGYGSILKHTDATDPYPLSSVASYAVSGERFRQVDSMRQINETFDGKIFGMSKRRRRQFPAIATVVEAFIAAVPNIGKVTFCGGSNRDGALMMKLPLEIRESNPLDVLAHVQDEEAPAFGAILRKLQSAIPADSDLSGVPTIFSTGLGRLFVRAIWQGHGHDDDTNSACALHEAISRNSDCPGLTHLARAVHGLTLSAKWGGNLNVADGQLEDGLSGIARAEHPHAAFWSRYIGAVARVVSSVLPVLPVDPRRVDAAVRFKSRLERKDNKKPRVLLKIGIAPDDAKGIDLTALASRVEAAAAKYRNAKPPIKVTAEAAILS